MAEPDKCSASSKDCIHYRRCFMSGEYCSRQANIQKERERLHAEGKINAFVIMDFSNMSTVVYNWRIKPFIESLKNYLQLEGDKIICYPERIQQTEKGERNATPVKQTQIVQETLETLKTVLHRFQGVEALYRVKVKTGENSDCDSRKSKCIRPLEGDSVSCLFVD